MLKTFRLLYVSTIVFAIGSAPLMAQGNSQNVNLPDRAAILVPGSSVEMPEDHGQRAHTNHLILLRPEATGAAPAGMTPNKIYGAYNVSPGGSGIIAIVDAYDYPTAEADLATFSSQFGLPDCTTANGCFQKVYAAGKVPRADCGWAQEAALDIQWAHAMAPDAKIVLVEAASARFTDLLAAVDVASNIVAANGGKGQVSMSWGGSEFSGETSYDSRFTKPGVVYFAASGDTGGKTIWPGVSPNAVSAGGTSLRLSSSGSLISETGWSGSGGGASAYEARPAYQGSIQSIIGSRRGTPDMSFDADPNTGVSVYDSTKCQGMSGWLVFGGTSVSSPALAGIVNSAGHGSSSTSDELNMVYSRMGTSDFRDITSGTAGSYTAKAGWDFVTGVGSSVGMLGK